MSRIVLFCENCGAPFPTNMFFNGGIASVGKIASGPCRLCGGRCSISDLVMVNVGGALRTIAGAVHSREELRELSELLEEATNRGLPPDEVIDYLRRRGAQWPGLWDQIAALLWENKGDIMAFLSLILTALPFILPQQEITAEQIDKIVQKAVVTAVDQLEKHHPAAQPAATGSGDASVQQASRVSSTGRTGRNQPCPCSSGKRHKECCGSLGGK